MEKKMTKKVLYFEGAGCVPCNDVENCRIRTAFTNKEGKKVYIEFISGYKHTLIEYGKYGKKLKNTKTISESGYLSCDSCHYITDDPEIDDCNKSRLGCARNQRIEKVKYTKENILNFVNKYCNADFDEIIVLDDLAGFRVFADGKYDTFAAYNYGDEFIYDKELTEKRIEKVKEMKKYFSKLFNKEYDNTSYYINKDGKLEVKINVSDNDLQKANWNKKRVFVVEL